MRLEVARHIDPQHR
jgi:hypothetical protein